MLRCGGVHMSSESKRRRYDREFKVDAVRLSHEPGRTVAGVARDLGISTNMLHRWRLQLSQDEGSAFPGKGRQSAEQEELRRLHRQLADVTEERDILKKALAVFSCRPQADLIHHSDRGRQYAADNYRKLLTDHGLISSMSRKGDCRDNAPMESFWGTLKQELIYHERFHTKEEARLKIFEYIEVFYNCQRRHSSLGSVSPDEYERLTLSTEMSLN
jgi:transposase InsO family protein